VKRTQIAYRCPECSTATVGFLGTLPTVSDMLRLRCECGEFALEIKRTGENKLVLKVPCIYCKDSHSYTLSGDIIVRDEVTRLSCPYSNMDICFIADEEDMSGELDRSASELSGVLTSLEVDDVSDIQPQDLDANDAPPDPAIFDVINFLVRDLEAEGEIHCPCKNGEYDLRFTDEGMQVYCKKCGASYEFYAKSVATAENYIDTPSITLK